MYPYSTVGFQIIWAAFWVTPAYKPGEEPCSCAHPAAHSPSRRAHLCPQGTLRPGAALRGNRCLDSTVSSLWAHSCATLLIRYFVCSPSIFSCTLRTSLSSILGRLYWLSSRTVFQLVSLSFIVGCSVYRSPREVEFLFLFLFVQYRMSIITTQ